MKWFTLKWRMGLFTGLIIFLAFPLIAFAQVDVPKILITPNLYDFGTLTVGQTRGLQVTIKNRGEAILQLSDITSSSHAYVLSDNCTNQSLAPNKLCRLNVTFQPLSDGIQNATLSISSNDPAKPIITMSLKGKGILLIPKIKVSSTADYQFGAIDVNETQGLWIRIANTGNGPLEIGEIVSSTDEFFLKTPNCAAQTISPDNECKMELTFKPQSGGIRNAILSIASNDPDRPVLKVSLKGEGIPLTHKISVLDKTVDFGLQAIDSRTTENFRITSKGTGDLQLGLIQVSSNDFIVDATTCANKTMRRGRDCFVAITFHPQSGGTKNAMLSIQSDDPEMPVLKVSLTGQGQVFIPNITVNSSDYDFGEINVGKTKSLYLEIENRGEGELKLGQLKLANQAAFNLSHDKCTNSSLGASQLCTVLMIFQPKSAGNKTVNFSIPSNDPEEPSVIVSLKGKAFAAPKIFIKQTDYQFGIVKVGSASAASMLVIQNTGNDDLELGEIRVLNDHYHLMPSCANKTLAPQGQCTLIIAFKPQSEGVQLGNLSIASNDPDAPNLQVSLEGEGRELMLPAIDIVPNAIQFEDIQYGKTSAVQTITVKNVGKGPLSIKGLGFTEGHRYDFRLQQDNCAYQSLAPSTSCSVQLQFQPTAIGSRIAQFYLLSDDPDTPTASISLAGTGNTPDGLACPTTPTIQSVQNGPWNSPSTWDQNRVPNVDDIVGIHPNHSVMAQAPYYQEKGYNKIKIKGLCHHGVIRHGYQTWWFRKADSRYRDGYGYLSLEASAFIYNYGQILGNTGYSGYYYGGEGGSLYLSTQGAFYNAPKAIIRGGEGYRNQQYAGDGGHVEIHGHHMTNLGTLCAGNASPAGYGGNLTITGSSILRNEGLLCGGEGQKGSFVSIQSRPLVMLNGGTLRTSKEGQIWIGSDIILADKATRITGGQITLSGGDNVILDISRFAANAISASKLITLTVGNGSLIDFKASSDLVLKAPEVKLQTDRVLLPEDKSLTDKIDTPDLIIALAKTLRKVSLNTPASFAAEPGETLAIPLTLINHGPKQETYQFSVTDTAGWVLGTLPSTLRLDGLQTRTLFFKVTLPATSSENTIKINVLSSEDTADIMDTLTVRVSATTEQIIDDGRQHQENDTPFEGHETDESEHQGETTAGDETTDQGEADNPSTETGPSYLVSGNIRDKFNNPLPGVTVQVGEQTTLTNQEGDWQIDNLAQGNYTATASQTGYHFQTQNVTVGHQEKGSISFKASSLLNLKVVTQPHVPEQGENIIYMITVSNQGLETATGLLLTEVLPENTRLVSIETLDGHCESSTLSCTLADLAPSEQTTVEIVVSNQEAEKLINTVQITSHDYPADLKTTWTAIRPYLSVVVRDAHDPISLTDRVQRINGINGFFTLKYTITTTLNDNAPTKATEVELEITLPNGVELQAINTDYGNCDLSQRPLLSCSLNDLGGNDNLRQIPVHIEVRLKDAGLLLLTLAAQITSKDYPVHTDRERTEISIGDIEVDFALLLDVSASMQTEIAELLEAVKRSEDWAKGKLVLITFTDEVTVKALTQNINVLQTALEQLEAKGGGSCPEASIEALEVAIPHVKPGGTIFIITDASPYPDADIESVIEQLLSKGIRLDAQITGDCSIESSWN